MSLTVWLLVGLLAAGALMAIWMWARDCRHD